MDDFENGDRKMCIRDRLCGARFPGAAGWDQRDLCGGEGAFSALALCPHADRHERQQGHGCPAWKIRAVFWKLCSLVGGISAAGVVPFEKTGRAGVEFQKNKKDCHFSQKKDSLSGSVA